MRVPSSLLGPLLIIIIVAVSVKVQAATCDQGVIARLIAYGKSYEVALRGKNAKTKPAEPKENLAGLSEFAGACEQPNQSKLHGNQTDTYQLVARPDAEAAFARHQKMFPGRPWRRYDGQALSLTDFIAIDALARTLMGEMGNGPRCGKPYMAGVARVIMNRGIELFNRPEKSSRMFGSGKVCTDFSQCVTNAALMPRQFSVWNHFPYNPAKISLLLTSKNKAKINKGHFERDANDNQESVTQTALCPRGGPGINVIPSQQKIWQHAVEIAAQAVTAPFRMKEITPDIHALWFTSGMSMCGGTALPAGHAYGQSLDKKSCLEFWIDNHDCHRKE